MKLMNLEQYVIYGKYLEHLRQNPHITPVRREKDGVMYTWIEDFENNQGFWLSDPQKFEPPPFSPSEGMAKTIETPEDEFSIQVNP